MKTQYTLLASIAAVALVGCQPEDVKTTVVAPSLNDVTLVVAASSYPTSDIAVIAKKESDTFTIIENKIATVNPGDIAIFVDGETGYRIGRKDYNSVTKFTWDLDSESIQTDWNYSVKGEDDNPNPHSMTKASNNSAYLTRWDAKSIWQVNLDAESQETFKIAEIDLSAFAHTPGTNPHMTDAALVDNKLFVLLQKLNGYTPESNSVVAIIDVTDNSLIDIDPVTEGIQVIDLGVRNANKIFVDGTNLLISAAGDAYKNLQDITQQYTGGIVSVDTSTYDVSLLLDDGDETNAPYGNITAAVKADTGDIYFIGYISWGNNKLYRLAPNAGIAREVSLSDSALNISSLATKDSDVYVGVHANETAGLEGGIHVLTTTRDQSEAFIPMLYNPSQIEIAE